MAESAPAADPNRVYLGNINKDTTEETVRSLFAGVTSVEFGPSHTYGWVVFGTAANAAAACAHNGKTVDGYEIRVEPHRPRARVDASGARTGNPARVYVGNLPREVTENEVRPLFEAHGAIESLKVGPPRGRASHAYVLFADVANAEAAIAALNGAEQLGVTLRVEAESRRPRARGSARRGRRSRADTGEPAERAERAEPVPGNPRRVYVGNTPRDLSSDDLHAHFASCGGIVSAKALRRGCGYVTFETEEQAQEAVKLSGTTLGEREIVVQPEMRRPRTRRRAAAARPAAGAGGSAGGAGERRAGGRAGRRRTAASDDDGEEAPPQGSADTIWVGGLPDGVTEDQVREAFASSGAISEVRFGRSNRFGYVVFATADAAAAASASGTATVNGTEVTVQAENRSSGRGTANPCRVYVGNLPEGTLESTITELLKSAGSIAEINLRDGFAHVLFETAEAADLACSISGKVGDNEVRIERALPPRRRRRRGPPRRRE